MNKELKKLEKVFQERDELATKNRELEARLQAVLPLEPVPSQQWRDRKGRWECFKLALSMLWLALAPSKVKS